jgi:hypothetical protein
MCSPQSEWASILLSFSGQKMGQTPRSAPTGTPLPMASGSFFGNVNGNIVAYVIDDVIGNRTGVFNNAMKMVRHYDHCMAFDIGKFVLQSKVTF